MKHQQITWVVIKKKQKTPKPNKELLKKETSPRNDYPWAATKITTEFESHLTKERFSLGGGKSKHWKSKEETQTKY